MEMKPTKIIIATLAIGMVFAGTAKVSMQNNAVISSNGIDLVVESQQDVHGIQFDLKYDTSELTFNGAEAVNDGFTFEYKEREDGSVRGLMFSMQGEKLNTSDVSSLIKFDFEGQGKVDFDNVILAGENGVKIESTFASFDVNTLPIQTELKASYPNPFNPSTTINYDLAADGNVNIVIYDALGRVVTELANGFQTKGNDKQITWDASNQASGAYFLRMTAENYTTTQKLMLVK